VHSFEDSALVSEVGAGNEAEPANEAGAEVADDVAVEVFEEQRVVLVGVHDELHAGVVNDVLAVENFRELLAHLTGATQEQPIGHLHDVGFVDGVNFLRPCLRA